MANPNPTTAEAVLPDVGIDETLEDETGQVEGLESPESEQDQDTTEYEEDDEEEDESPFGEWSAETAADKPFQAIVYGPPGGGKTHYAATFPKPLFIDLENGLRSTLKMGPVLRYPKNPDKKITKLDQVRDAFQLIRTDPNPKYETIVIDSLQELQILVTDEVLGRFKGVSRQMDDQLTYQDYGKINRTFLAIVRNFLKLPYHIVMTSVQTEPEYDGALVYPAFSGKGIWKDLQRIVEQIGYVTVRKNDQGKLEHMVSFLLSDSYVAKDRVGITERWLPNHFDALIKYAAKPKSKPMNPKGS